MEVQVRESKQDIGLNTCILPVDIFKAFNLSPDVMYNIHFGRVSQYSYILPGDQEKSGMFFSKLIFSQLALFEDITLNIKNVGKDIYLGPVVGIFVTPEYFKKMLDANRNFHTEQHLRGGFSQGCFVYYFTLENINWTEKKVYGYTLFPSTKKGGMYWMPMPDIMYDRAVNHSLMYKFNAEQVRRQFQNGLNIRCINSRISFGKWEIYKGLSKHRQIKKYLPETKPYKRGKDFIHMLDKYGFLFLKSFYGSSGKEVLSIEKEDKKFKLNFYDKGLRNMSFDDISQVEGFIKSFMKEKSFIVQQGIRLLEFKGRKFDVRMVLQKDENGLWKSNLNVCRLAKDKLTITNVDTGGEITTYEEIYPDLFIQGGKVPD
ncbi:MAG: YheC/YheD family protein, partial [Bacillota bacterium]|nr:YheC/YheD family protein [Bacillota bacterium]